MNGAYSWKFILFGFVINVFSIFFVSASADAGSVGKFQTVSITTHFKTPRNTDVIPAKAVISLISRVNQSKLFFIPLNDEAREYLYETVGPLQMPMVNGEEIPSLASIKSGEAPSGRLGSLPFANCMEMDQSEFEKTVAWASCEAGVENPLKVPRGREYAESYLKPPSDEPSEEEMRQKISERVERVGFPDFFVSISGTVGGKGGVTLDIFDRIREILNPTPPPPPEPPFREPPPPPPPPPPPADDPDGDDDGDGDDDDGDDDDGDDDDGDDDDNDDGDGDDEGDGEDPKTQPDPNAPSDPNPECMEEDDVMSDVERGSPTYGQTNPVEGTLSGRLGRFAACIMEAELVPQISYCRTDEVAHCDNETGICTCRPLAEEGEGEPPNNQCQTLQVDCITNPTHDCC